jgi:DNA helicase-2/ATP-dependent DNA helicase PcrA
MDALPQTGDSGVATGLRAAVEDLQRKDPGETDTRDTLAALIPLAEACGRDVARFRSEIALGADLDLWDPRADRVSLLTLHAAKGLEFSVVFVVGCEDGLLPLRWGPSDDVDLEEERRLFFVGMTRARERLFLTHAKKRMWQGKVRPREMSPFLQDIRNELLDRSTQRHRKRRSSHAQLDLF